MTTEMIRTNRTRQLPIMPTLRDNQSLEEAVIESAQGLSIFGPQYDYWAVSYSGGKDSTCTTTLVLYLIEQGIVPAPKKLLVLRSDTLMEEPILDENANQFMQYLREYGKAKGWTWLEVESVAPPLEKTFYVQILGRGLQPPKQMQRWCTRALKVDPMKKVVDQIYQENGNQKFLMISGMRNGESVVRDKNLMASLEAAKPEDRVIAPICSKDSGECGTGLWVTKSLAKSYVGLALISHWRTCHVYDWLQGWHTSSNILGFDVNRKHDFIEYTRQVARIYGQHDDGTLEEDGSRFGCIECPLMTDNGKPDRMINRVIKLYGRSELGALHKLPLIWLEMRKPQYRYRGGGRRKFTSPDPNRLGPLTLKARLFFLEQILTIQKEAGVILINAETEALIRKMIAEKVFPMGWDGTEPTGVNRALSFLDGSYQTQFFGPTQEAI